MQTLLYVGAGLGLLTFIWGFLDWANHGAGYETSGTGAIVAIVSAGIYAAALALERKSADTLAAVLAVTGLLVTFGVLIAVSGEDGVSIEVGLILTLITSLAQAAVLVYGWLVAIGRVAGTRPHHPPSGPVQPGYPQQGPPPQGFPQSAPPGGPSQPPFAPPPNYGPPPG
jgi:hypothetical protein